MKAKVHEAQKFDPEKFVNDYLEDMKYELVPKTYKGKRLPRFMIKVCTRFVLLHLTIVLV